MYVGLDIGGTKTLVAVFDDTGVITEQFKFPTPTDYEQFVHDLQTQVHQLETTEFRAGAIGIRGNIDRDKGLAVLDDVLAWRNAPVRNDCENIFKCSFVLENDSKVAAVGELPYADPTDTKLLYITISTGIGSAFIVNGGLETATINSEIGKSIYEHDGKFQSWEDFASGKAIVAKYGKRASEIGDPKIWKEISYTLAPGIIDAAAAYTPDVIVVGGGVGAHLDKFQTQLEETIKELLPEELPVPKLRKAKHAEEAVIYGCYQLAKQYKES